MFFEHLQSSNGPTTMFDHYCARLLFSIVRQTSPGRHWRKLKWAEQIRLLRNDQKQNTDLIEEVLLWLVSKWKEKGILPTSAKWFRSNFNWISSAASKSPLPPKMEASVNFAKLMKATKRLIWPKGIPEDLDAFVLVSEANYTSFKERLRILFEERSKWPKLSRLLEHLHRSFPSVQSFVLKWIEQTHKRVCGWDDWSGKLMSFSFQTASKEFKKYGMSLTVQFSGDSKNWFKVMELLGEPNE